MMPPSLIELLKAYEGIWGSSEVVAAFEKLILETPAPFSRSQFPGHITASCFVISPTGERILLMQHRKLKKWLQMGGHCDGECDTRSVALREAQEEAGSSTIRLFKLEIIDLDIHRIPKSAQEPEHFHYDVRYVGLCEEPQSIQKAEAECTDLKWFSWEEAFQVAQETSMHRVFKKIIQMKL